MNTKAVKKLWPLALLVVGLLLGYMMPQSAPEMVEEDQPPPSTDDTARPSELCLLWLYTGCHPCDRIEVLIDGKNSDTYDRAERSSDPRCQRIYFEASGRTHFVFQLYRNEELQYQPEFDLDLTPGALISASFMPSESRPQTFETRPYCWSPNVGKQVPSKVWCFFGLVEILENSLNIDLTGTGVQQKIRKKLEQNGYAIIRQGAANSGKTPWFTMHPPQGMTVVDAMKNLETWPGVESVDPMIPVN